MGKKRFPELFWISRNALKGFLLQLSCYGVCGCVYHLVMVKEIKMFLQLQV